MIKLKNISVKYVNDYYSLYNVNLEINGNSLLIGSESSGKSFLLRILAKIDKNYEGEIFVDGKNLKQIKDKDLNLAYIPQIPYLFENKSVIENLIYPLKIRKISKNEAILRAKTAIKPYFFKFFENFNKINDDLNKTNKIKIDSNRGSQSSTAEQISENNKSNNDINTNFIFNADETTFNYLKEQGHKNNFEKFLKTKVKKLNLATKKIITLLRAKIREPKYILIENFFENLDDNYFNLANQIISDLKTTSTIIATQNNEKIIPAYNNFKQIFFDAGIIKN